MQNRTLNLLLLTCLALPLLAACTVGGSESSPVPTEVGSALVSGEILVGEDIPAFNAGVAYVYLEEVGRADAPALKVAEQILRDLAHQPGNPERFAFRLDGELPDESGSYAVRVHVDLDGDGQVSTGDLISTESYPVLTQGYPDQVTVRVSEVR